MVHILRRTLIGGGSAALLTAPAFAQSSMPPAPVSAATGPPPPAFPGAKRVAMKTAKGLMLIDLAVVQAPITAGAFLRHVRERLYDGAEFYRASHAPGQPTFGLIEGGVENEPARIPKPIRHESTAQTGLSHKDGTLSMARLAPGTATSEFFICIGDQPGYDANTDPAARGDTAGFAAFGRVVDGTDTVQAIFNSPVSATAGSGVMKGEMLHPPIRILSVREQD